jgi:hypothetical protein
MGLDNGGGSAKKRGRPRAGDERSRRHTRATQKAADGRTPGVVRTIERARRNEAIYQGWLAGRDHASLGREHDLSERTVAETLDQLRADTSWQLAPASVRRRQQNLHALLLRRRTALSEAAEMLQRAVASGNLLWELGARKYRDQALTQYETRLRDTARIPSSSKELEGEQDAENLVAKILGVFEKHGVEDPIGREIRDLIVAQRLAAEQALAPEINSEKWDPDL